MSGVVGRALSDSISPWRLGCGDISAGRDANRLSVNCMKAGQQAAEIRQT